MVTGARECGGGSDMRSLRCYRDCPYDASAAVRGLTAAQLAAFDGPAANRILLRLAKDKKAQVRMEAYDSLAAYDTGETFRFLQNAIGTERDALARSYAILSCGDVFSQLPETRAQRDAFHTFLNVQLNAERQPHCILAYYYALIQLGDQGVFSRLLSFLSAKDYHIRCTALAHLEDLPWPDDQEAICRAVAHVAAYRPQCCSAGPRAASAGAAGDVTGGWGRTY